MFCCLALILIVTGDEQYDRTLRVAKIVQVLAEKGEKIKAGPLTLFVDPQTHKLCKEVVADPESRRLIPAIYRVPGDKSKTVLYFVLPVSARPREAVMGGSGSELLIVAPDMLGDRDVRNRTFWAGGKREKRRFVREVGYYDVVAYTSRDVFARMEVPNDVALEDFSWTDDGEKVTTVPIAGYRAEGVQTPDRVEIGQSYPLRVNYSVRGTPDPDELALIEVKSQGTPPYQSRAVPVSELQGKPAEFQIVARNAPTEASSVMTSSARTGENPREGLCVYDAADAQAIPGKVAEERLPEGVKKVAESGGKDIVRRSLPFVAAGVTTGLALFAIVYDPPEGGESRKTARPFVQLNADDDGELERAVSILYARKVAFDPHEAEKVSAQGKAPRELTDKSLR